MVVKEIIHHREHRGHGEGRFYSIILCVLCVLCGELLFPIFPSSYIHACAEVKDPFDPFDFGLSSVDEPDENKTPQDLLLDATILMSQERLLDARTKLLKALQKDPQMYQAHTMLAGYYLVHVGHFRLSLKYIKQAQALFEKINGAPPYPDEQLKREHAQILYLISQIRLNLDDYEGALQELDNFTAQGYYGEWYPGTRAWVLMKLGKVEDAIKVAKLGALAGAEPGRTLNMLGILLSMHNDREASLNVFKEAIRYEMSLGELGQPATPLNNSGEVYKEIFKEDQAENNWLKATSLPDGCEHVLPALNLSLLYIEQLKFEKAKKTMDNFDSCIAQYPLRNGEEHRALVHMARGRIALHTGHIEDALKHLNMAIENRQWFGKIGTSVEDLESATLISLAQALHRESNIIALRKTDGFFDYIDNLWRRTSNELRAWWLKRRARGVLIDDLSSLEDLYIRNTDSMIEYPTFGELLADIPTTILNKRIDLEKEHDGRQVANIFYQAYMAENMIKGWKKSQGVKLLDNTVSSLRPKYDDLLLVHLQLLKLSLLEPGTEQYNSIIDDVFVLAPAEVRNYGFKLPVNLIGSAVNFKKDFEGTPFLVQTEKLIQTTLDYEFTEGKHRFLFDSKRSGKKVTVKGEDIGKTINLLADQVFSEEI